MKTLSTILLVVAAIAFQSCEREDEKFKYDTKDNIYFGIKEVFFLDELSLARVWPEKLVRPWDGRYSFAITQRGTDTVYFPVTVSGKRVSYDRKFKVVVGDSTFARENIHYEPLKDFYTIPADSGSMLLPLIIYNQDVALETTTHFIQLQLVATEDFSTDLPKKNTSAIFSFSNRLERPDWWTNWQGELGTYSRTKHALYIIALDGIEDKELVPNFEGDNGMLIPYNLYLIDKFRSLLISPFTWINDHPSYVLEEKSEGVYNFYSVENEFKKYTLSYFEQEDKYYFLDENNFKVSTDF